MAITWKKIAYDADKVSKATLTTKGDLYAATGAATIVRLGVGTDTHVLTADSGETPGIKWAAAAGGGGDSAFGTYAGNDSNNRQITTGFVCKLVIVQSVGVSGVNTWICLNTTGEDCILVEDTDQVDDYNKPYMHATDGFTLGGDTYTANNTGESYNYAAFG